MEANDTSYRSAYEGEDDAIAALELAFEEGRFADLRREVAKLPKEGAVAARGRKLVARTNPRPAETWLLAIAALLLVSLTTFWFRENAKAREVRQRAVTVESQKQK